MSIHGLFDPAEGEPCVACVALASATAGEFLGRLLDHPAVGGFQARANLTPEGAARLASAGIPPQVPEAAGELGRYVERLCAELSPGVGLDSPEAQEIMGDFGDVHGWLRKRQEEDGLAGLGSLELVVRWNDPGGLAEDDAVRFASFVETSALEAEAILGGGEAGEGILAWDLGDMAKLAAKAFLLVSQDLSDVPFAPLGGFLDFQEMSPAAVALLAWAIAETAGDSAYVFVASAQ